MTDLMPEVAPEHAEDLVFSIQHVTLKFGGVTSLSDTSLRLVTPPNLRVTCWIENTRSSACSGATSGIRSVIASPGLCSRARQGTTFRRRTAVSLPLTCCVRGRPDFPHDLRPPR